MNKILFKEEQQFRQWWYLLMMLGVIVPIIVFNIYVLIQQGYRGIQVGDTPAPTWVAIFTLFMMLLVLWLFFIMKLEVWIDREGVHYRFFPLIFKERLISVAEIRKYEIREYKPILDYGGWGVKKSFRWGRAYNVSGNIGLQLYLNNGKKVLFGTQRSQAIMYAMDEMMKLKTENFKH